jgi:ABC-type lipoprotein export system ATPase subunit
MSSIKFLKEVSYKPTFRTEQICGIYDLQPDNLLKKQFDFDVNLSDFEWQIGVIVGTSGSGKSSLAQELFQKDYDVKYTWNEDTSFINDFSKNIDIQKICQCLSNVGFSSPPLWLLPYSQLSTGQKFRVDVVRSILESKDICCIDEFTSVVDREVAKIGSHCVQKFVRRTSKKFVAISCHYDILEWLQPDWVFDVNKNELSRRSLRRPRIEFKIQKCNKEYWGIFRDYHYLNHNLHTGAQCFLGTINSRPVAFSSYLHFPHPTTKNAKREHRTVVLPDYQGLGLGNRISDFVAEYCKQRGFRYMSTTSQPSMIHYRNKSDLWSLTRFASHVSKQGKSSALTKRMTTSSNRLTSSFEYIGLV